MMNSTPCTFTSPCIIFKSFLTGFMTWFSETLSAISASSEKCSTKSLRKTWSEVREKKAWHSTYNPIRNWKIVNINVIIPIIAWGCRKWSHAGARTEWTPKAKPQMANATPESCKRNKFSWLHSFRNMNILFTWRIICNGRLIDKFEPWRPTRYPAGKIRP